MKTQKFGALALLGLMGLGLVMIDPAHAKPGRGNGNGNRPAPAETVDDSHIEADDELLTSDRVDTLIAIIYGTDEDYADLINDELRRDILADLDSLPPGIRRQLARGRGLPPGIAKKYQMPVSVLSVLDLEPDTELLIIGDSVVIVNPADVIIDIVDAIF